MNDEIVQYFIVNSELGMSTGKIAAQVAHVATLIANKYSSTYEPENPYPYEDYENWLNNFSQKKIILRGKEKDLHKLMNLSSTTYILDNGLTEVPKGSLTVVGFPPTWKSGVQKYVKRFQLL